MLVLAVYWRMTSTLIVSVGKQAKKYMHYPGCCIICLLKKGILIQNPYYFTIP